MIGFGLRLAVAGGREALTRLAIIAASVAVGSGLLLATLAGVNAVNSQLTRYASMYPSASTGGDADPLWWSTRDDFFHGKQITRIDVAATGAGAPTPVGIPTVPGPGEFYTSPALRELLATHPADQLGDRYPGRDSAPSARPDWPHRTPCSSSWAAPPMRSLSCRWPGRSQPSVTRPRCPRRR